MKPKFPNKIFVSGIGTGVGKTLTSAVLCEALQADYWKPVQTGSSEFTDRQTVQSLISNTKSRFHNESVLLKEPASPHYAAILESTKIEMEQLHMPDTSNKLIVEGAGGILVPLSDELVIYDIVAYFKLPVIIVCRNYLGSINHTLLTVEFLQARETEIAGIIFSGNNFNDNEQIIAHFSNLPILGKLDEADNPDKKFVEIQAEKMRKTITEHFIID